MNGRLYDPLIARFISADPIIADPLSVQAFNRYSYVDNNPLTYTDPTGYLKIGRLFRNPVVALAVGIVSAVALGPAGLGWIAGLKSLEAAIVVGAVAGGLTGGIKGAIVGGISGALTFGIGGLDIGFVGRAALHGVAQGGLAAAQDGDFGSAFLGAAIGSFGSSVLQAAIPGKEVGEILAKTVASAVVGGAASVAAGGKFANGAATSAFIYMFNHAAHAAESQGYGITPEQRTLANDGKVREFWSSRRAIGDPIADIALKSLDPPGGLIDTLFGGASINDRLNAFSRIYAGKDVNIMQIRVDLMRAHVIAVDSDARGAPGLLSPRQVAEYHHEVFVLHGLPATAFGGTPFTGRLGEANWTRAVWCNRCDNR
ncbi:RHS repeat-associated core domain-containing protein [Ferrovibrio sp.]|uniref:RHS repeat-associated core domain-containing protein n=1 Tax=Ferrovibrio sp. TaxID=1917215 RepID=UPI0025BFF426|nr:RHS repeat-associated core domain-containing protein [Ferrovibrio sp.]